MRYFLLLGLIVLLVVGCAKPQKVELVYTDKPEPVILQVPNVDKLDLEPLNFYVLNEKNVGKKFQDIKKKEGTSLLIALTEKGYKALSINMAKLRKIIKQLHQVVEAYKEFYEKNREVEYE